jgi:hypothetical protein
LILRLLQHPEGRTQIKAEPELKPEARYRLRQLEQQKQEEEESRNNGLRLRFVFLL